MAEFMADDRKETYKIEDGVFSHIATACAGDVRKAINSVELCVLSAPEENGIKNISIESAKSLTQKSAMRYDKDGDEHYDIISAYQKSMRGSDPDAAIHYLARLLEAGDLISACRRLLVCACEDVGLAYPLAAVVTRACCESAKELGMPEAQLTLANAAILLATAPKSNSAHNAALAAVADIENGLGGKIPTHLQSPLFKGYKYPHDYPNRYVEQQYLPDDLKNRKYYVFGDNKTEKAAEEYWKRIKGK